MIVLAKHSVGEPRGHPNTFVGNFVLSIGACVTNVCTASHQPLWLLIVVYKLHVAPVYSLRVVLPTRWAGVVQFTWLGACLW